MACNAQSLINLSYADGYAKLSERDLQACAVAAACAITGGGSGGAVSAGNGVPAAPPPGSSGLYIQKDSIPAGIIWEYYDGAWHTT